MESLNNYIFSLRNKRNCRTSCTSSKRGDISRIIAIWIGWKVGGEILWNAITICRMSKTSGKREISNMNEDLGNHSKDRERISVEKSHGDREEFQPEETKDDEGINKDFLDSRRSSGRLLGYWRDFIYRHHIEPSISQDFCCWTKLLWKDKTNRERDWRNFQRHHVQIIYGLCKRTVFPNMHTGNRCSKITRAEVSEEIHVYWYCRRKTEFCVVFTIWDTNSFQWTDLKESSSLFFVKVGACCLVLATQRICGTKFFE